VKKGEAMKTLMLIKEGNVTNAEEIEKFIAHLKDGTYQIEIKRINTKKYWQLKYYWGYLVEPMTFYSFNSKEEAHIFFKEKFLFYKANSDEEIPQEHKRKAIKYFYKTSSGVHLIGYLRSISTLDYEEMKQYILKVEEFMLQEGILSLDKEGLEIREKGINYEKV